eukprot:CAMPEP_0170082894 /NCGR_PEP_ID=MMETSP0019_2-20121128/18347_1 /TAXON_ID=98059 /ORGANISM="Dinobryon sp., Strain UTEXLB2267" /LENGTH=261 /DNA_ID=CAMNT_0010297951 /DNA_START=227 /DNA_END=1012 /DNA_ORIENTATION=+
MSSLKFMHFNESGDTLVESQSYTQNENENQIYNSKKISFVSNIPWNAPDNSFLNYSNQKPMDLVEQDTLLYKVQFKSFNGHYYFDKYRQGSHNLFLEIGEFVKVEADRGEDLGIITNCYRMQDFVAQKSYRKIDVKDDRPKFGKLLRIATASERAQLPEKYRQEMEVIATCKDLAQFVHHIPITILNAVFQFDRNKLTIYYASSCRVDFREFVRELFAIYKSRIWMEKVQLIAPTNSFNSVFDQALVTGQYPQLSVYSKKT